MLLKRIQLSGDVPIRPVCFYNRRNFEVRWFKGCSIHTYASIKVSVVRVCSYKAGRLL